MRAPRRIRRVGYDFDVAGPRPWSCPPDTAARRSRIATSLRHHRRSQFRVGRRRPETSSAIPTLRTKPVTVTGRSPPRVPAPPPSLLSKGFRENSEDLQDSHAPPPARMRPMISKTPRATRQRSPTDSRCTAFPRPCRPEQFTLFAEQAHERSAPMKTRFFIYLAVCATLTLPQCMLDGDANGQSAVAAAPADTSNVKDAVDIATDAYVYGYSLVTTDVTRIQMSNVPAVEELKAPLNQFANVKRYPPADYRGVSAPNADTLYSVAWLDLAEPQVFSHPDMGKRYFLFPMIDLWMTIFASPGTRTTGEKAGNFLITGPGWKGEVPKGLQHIQSATRYMVILGRTYADGTDADYKAANALQAQYKITPLSAWGKAYTPKAPPVDANPGISMTDKPQAVILAMGTEGYFNWLSKRMCEAAPAYQADGPMLTRMTKIGIEPCKPFELAKLDPAVQAALKDLPDA